MLVVNILLLLLIFLIFSDLFIKNLPESKLVLIPVDYKIQKKDGLSEIIVNFKLSNKNRLWSLK